MSETGAPATSSGKRGLDDFSGAELARYVGEEFVFHRPPRTDGVPSGEVRMTLLEVQQFPRQSGLTRDPFSLLFKMKNQAPLERGLPRLLHPNYEPLDIFLQRVTIPEREKMDPAAMYYEAVFS